MSPKKEIFDVPVVRVDTTKFSFPKVCPICGKDASKMARISAMPGRRQSLRPSLDPIYSPVASVRRSAPKHEVKSFVVYVCEDHYRSDEGNDNLRIISILLIGVASLAFILGLMALGDSLWRGVPVPTWALGTFVFFAITLGFAYIAFRPGPLEAAVEIVGFDHGFRNIWFKFRNDNYRDAFIQENPMNSELVTWIMRA